MEAIVEALPAWFEASAGFGEKLAAIKVRTLTLTLTLTEFRIEH